MQCSMAWALHRTEKEKPAAGKTDYWRDFWRSGWDSNPRNLAVQLISSQSRYDHFDTAPYLSQHQHLGKRGELMGRTSKNIKLRKPEKPHKIKGFRSGSYRVATTISSQSRYDHFDTAPYLSQHQHLGKRGELMGRTSKNIKLRKPEKPHKIKGFRSGSYRVATTISSQPRYDHFDTAAQYRLLYTQPPEKSRLIYALDRGISQCYTMPGTSQCDISR